MIGTGEKGCADIRFSAKSNGGHASRPPKNSPLIRLGKFMCEVERSHLFEKKLGTTAKEMLRRMAKGMKQPLRTVLGHPDLFSPLIKAVLPSVSAFGAAMLQTTLAFTVAHGSDSTNALPEEAYVVGNMRFSHHQGFEASLAAVKKIADKYDIEVTVLDPGITTKEVDFRSEAFRTMEEAVRSTFENVTPSPYLAMSASDNRFMSLVSDNCFGFSPFNVSDQQLAAIHGIDENIDISCLPKAVAFYQNLMKNRK